MKLNRKRLIIYLIGLFVLGLVARFGYFEYVSSTYIHPQPTPEGAMARFYFEPKRDRTSGFMMKFIKNMYALDLMNKEIEMRIEYTDKFGQARTVKKTLKTNRISNGNQRVSFEPLLFSKGQKVTVTLIPNWKYEYSDDLRLSNQDYNPNPELNTAPRVIYQVTLRHIALEIWESFTKDQGFAYFHLSVGILLWSIISALILLEPNELVKVTNRGTKM